MARSFVLVLSGIAVCICALWPLPLFAQSLQSPNYRFDEGVIGTGGMLQSSSANFEARGATGDIAIGNSQSDNFQIDSGTNTSPNPALSFEVLTSAANFGTFTPSNTLTANASFRVSNYTTYGYVVQLVGTPLRSGNSTIDAMSATTTPQPGVEQFGVNLVANTIPASFGANLNNGDFGYGNVAPDYATPNEFRYVSGETIAYASRNSGQTTYTISYVVNVAQLTPGGIYASNQTLIVTGTY